MKIHLPVEQPSAKRYSTPSGAPLVLDPDILEAVYTNKDEDLKSLSEQKVVMLVFLRQFGCSFCREAMHDLSQLRQELTDEGIELVMVHMSEDEIADDYFNQYGLPGVSHIGDPDLSLYEYFGLHKGSFWQLYGLKTWIRGIMVGYFKGMGLESNNDKLGDVTQMPGIFMIKNSQIIHQFIHKTAADRPDYKKLTKGKR